MKNNNNNSNRMDWRKSQRLYRKKTACKTIHKTYEEHG